MATDNKKLVLLIEDEIDVAQLYQTMLEEAGYEVLTIDDGTLGMAAIREKDWDVLLLDIMLPGKDGIKILQDIFEHTEHKKGPIIVVSNLNNQTTIKDAFTYGADSYVIKSEMNPDTLLSEVSKVFEKSNGTSVS